MENYYDSLVAAKKAAENLNVSIQNNKSNLKYDESEAKSYMNYTTSKFLYNYVEKMRGNLFKFYEVGIAPNVIKDNKSNTAMLLYTYIKAESTLKNVKGKTMRDLLEIAYVKNQYYE